MEDYTFQLASHDEIPEIVSIYHSLLGMPGCAWSRDYPSKETAKDDVNNNWLYKLKKNGEIIAVVSIGDFDEIGDLSWKPKNPCELARLGVVPAFQKQGIGTIILQHTINTAKALGYDGIRMLVSKTNPIALALYEKNNFERCGEIFRFNIDYYCYQMVF